MIRPETSQPGLRRKVLALAIPIVLANLTQPALSAFDTAIAGHMKGGAALGGVALGGLFFNLVFWGFGFLRMGTTGFVAQAFGAGDRAELRAIALRAIFLSILSGASLLLIRTVLIGLFLRFIGGSPVVATATASYAEARIWSAPATLGNYVVLGFLLGCQRTRMALALQLLINLANAALALLFVYGFGAGVGGLGAATAMADGIGLAVGGFVLVRSIGLRGTDWHVLADGPAMVRLLAVNRDIFLRTICLIGSFAWFGRAGAHGGDVVLAANALLLNFQTCMAFALDGFAQAAETLVGAAVGARDAAALRSATRAALFWSLIGAASFSLFYALAGGPIIHGLTDQPAVREAAMRYLPWAVVLPPVSVVCFLFDGVFIGATRTRELRNGMAIALAGFLLAATALQPPFGNDGLWAAFILFMLLRGAVLAAWYPAIGRSLATTPRSNSDLGAALPHHSQ